MPNKNLIQVFEYQKIRFTDANDFTENHFKSLVKFNEENDNKYFKPVYNGIQFGSYVGVIQIGGLTIEILPKADKSKFSTQLEKDTWQNVLLHMLKVCKKIQVETVSETQLKKKYHSILEAYFSMYLKEVEYLVKRGLIRKYRKTKSNQLALKGKLVFAQNIQKNTIHKERFYCEHQVYDKNHLIHQILLKGLQVLSTLSNSHLTNKVNKLLFQFEDIQQVNITSNHFKKVKLNRKSQPYERALSIAKMLILNYSPNISFGQDNMLTLLFDMNILWEEYIFRTLNKHKPYGYNVSYQNSDTFWEHKKIRPDIIITSPTNENFVIDTKWKIVESNNPSDNDLKQMFAYNLHWESSKSMLLYPQINQQDSSFGSYIYEHLSEKPNQCKLGFVSVLENCKIKEGAILSKEIFNKLRHEDSPTH